MLQNDNIDFQNICSITSFHFSKLKKKNKEKEGEKKKEKFTKEKEDRKPSNPHAITGNL